MTGGWVMIWQALWNLLAIVGHLIWAVLAWQAHRSWRKARRIWQEGYEFEMERGDSLDRAEAYNIELGMWLRTVQRQACVIDNRKAVGTRPPV